MAGSSPFLTSSGGDSEYVGRLGFGLTLLSNTIAIQLHDHCAIDATTDPRCLCDTPYNIGDGNLV